jgi:3-oxoacyl-[acyl-carrier protein] reductase
MMKQCVIISGGGGGVGLFLTREYLARGFYVATFTRNENTFLDYLKDNYNEQLYISRFDARDIGALKKFVNDVKSRFSVIDILINNIGYLYEGLQIFTSDREIKKTLDTNVISPFIMIREVSGVMMKARKGVIINISSINSLKGHRGVSLYSLSKAAMDGVTRSLAKELGPLNIRVNSVVPGFFASGLVASVSEARRKAILKRTALPRLGTSSDVAKVVLFLTSEDASFITGQSIVVDGGITC